MSRSLGKVWRNPDGTECCGGPESRRHLCPYHDGYTAAMDVVCDFLELDAIDHLTKIAREAVYGATSKVPSASSERGDSKNGGHDE